MNNTEQAEFFVEKILQSTRSTFEMFGMYIAVRLGYYKALSDGLVCNPPIEPSRATIQKRLDSAFTEKSPTEAIKQTGAKISVSSRTNVSTST